MRGYEGLLTGWELPVCWIRTIHGKIKLRGKAEIEPVSDGTGKAWG
ncbi:hypothetical protein [Metallosphaera javensis (ex Sakai et al. 2022)]